MTLLTDADRSLLDTVCFLGGREFKRRILAKQANGRGGIDHEMAHKQILRQRLFQMSYCYAQCRQRNEWNSPNVTFGWSNHCGSALNFSETRRTDANYCADEKETNESHQPRLRSSTNVARGEDCSQQNTRILEESFTNYTKPPTKTNTRHTNTNTKQKERSLPEVVTMWQEARTTIQKKSHTYGIV